MLPPLDLPENPAQGIILTLAIFISEIVTWDIYNLFL